jgi:hypothetical protein
VQRQHRDFLVFQVVAGDLTAFAVKDEVVGSVPVLNDVEAFLNLLSQRLRVQILTEEDRLDRFAQLGECQVSWMLEVVAREASMAAVSAAPSRKAVAYLTI